MADTNPVIEFDLNPNRQAISMDLSRSSAAAREVIGDPDFRQHVQDRTVKKEE